MWLEEASLQGKVNGSAYTIVSEASVRRAEVIFAHEVSEDKGTLEDMRAIMMREQ